ncbi:MAG: HAD family hydrolase [Clostridia bacterium]|nr:HAD family hydrolase [Clostridia bacterium]
MQTITDFVPQHEKLLCIDSDGTVIDAMNVKHRRCHGASFIEEWGLRDHAAEVQKAWDDINLYERTRGENRFLALDDMLTRMEGVYVWSDMNERAGYRMWLRTGEHTNQSLAAEYERTGNPLLYKALCWSHAINDRINAVTTADKPPFAGVTEALNAALGKVDIAVISSSNMSALLEEWGAYDLLRFPSVITSLEIGPKPVCIRALLAKGYAPENVLMIGDAYPDADAAAQTGVRFYPILTRHESESWAAFKATYLPLFLAGDYGKVQPKLLDRFAENFGQRS